jgi:hypothetical protein
MFCANVLLHNPSFDPRSSLAGNVALNTNIPLGIEGHGLHFNIYCTHSQKRKKIKNLVIEQCSSPQGWHCQAHKRHKIELIRGCLTTKEFLKKLLRILMKFQLQ